MDTEKQVTVGVPYSNCPYESLLRFTREDEAVAFAAGYKLAGGDPLVFMQNSGLGHCVDVITSLLNPYKIRIKFEIQNRFWPKHHFHMGMILYKLLILLEIYNDTTVSYPKDNVARN